ncbi:MAG: hypothetical protein F4026_02275, partial [Synechococcus sp. SB0669_bin_8]|nr:hypothetical protein [Synechococcus sp. SB0669_bin_8]
MDYGANWILRPVPSEYAEAGSAEPGIRSCKDGSRNDPSHPNNGRMVISVSRSKPPGHYDHAIEYELVARKKTLWIHVTVVAPAPAANNEPDGYFRSLAAAGQPFRPPSVSVRDATVQEGHGAVLAFELHLHSPSDAAVSVDYGTRNGTATAGLDYTAASGTVTFAPGETRRTATVRVLEDVHDEGNETFELVLSNPFGGAVIADGVALVTIENTDPMPAAWLPRFGRTVSQQVVDALQERFSAPPTPPGLHLTMAGEELTGSGAPPLAENQQVLAKLLGFETVTTQQLVEGSSFSFSPEGGSASFAFWGQGALTSFSGQQNNVSFDGDVTTALLGA